MSFQIVLGRIGSDVWANSRLRIIKQFVGPGRVLDLGCGKGYIGKSLNNDVVFGEINPEEFKDLDSNKKTVLNALNLPFKSGYFDYVICSDMLEHIDDDIKVLEEINRVLKEGGKAIIMVPAYQRLFGHHDRIMDHKRRYDKRIFKNKIAHLDFDIAYVRYTCSLLFIPFLFNQLFVKSGKTYFGKSRLEPKILPLLNFISLIESKIKLPFGIGLFYVLKKK